jgi:hypothetical protein
MFIVRGRNILDEGFGGSNVLDSNNQSRFTREGALSLSRGIRSAVSGGSISTNSVGSKNISLAASEMAKNLGLHTEAVQKLLDSQGDELKAELAKLVKMMSNAQRLQGEKSTQAIKEIVTQVKLIQAAPGGRQLSENLGLDSVSKNLNQTMTSKLQESLNVDIGAGFFGTIKQAFEPSRMFQGGSFLGLGGSRFNRINTERQARSRLGDMQSTGALENVMNQLGMTSSKTTLSRVPSTGPGVTPRFQSGLDELGEPGKQTFLLQEILKELKKISGQGSSGGLAAGLLGGAAGGLATRVLSILVTRMIPIVVAGLAAYGFKEFISDTARDSQERFKDDIIPGRPNVQYNAAKRQLVTALGRAPTEQEVQDFIDGKTITNSETSTPPLTPLTEDQGQVLTIGEDSPTQAESLTPVEAQAQGSLIPIRNTIPVVDPKSGKTIEVYSERQAQRVRDGEFDIEAGKFIDPLSDQFYNSDGIDPNDPRLRGYNSTPVSNLQSSILQTGNAVENMTGISPMSGTVVNNIVNNVASNQGGSRKFEQPSIAVSADTVRNSNNVVAEANRRSYIA